MLLVVGLGNPGPAYARNRHNIGFRVAAAYRELVGGERFARSGSSEIARGRRRGRPLLIMRPLEYMNCSGDAVAAVMRREKIDPEEILVVVDDIYLPLGRLRLRKQGGDGGHNGLKSLIDVLASARFARLRFGVGGPPPGRDMKDWVLEDFTAEEEAKVGPAVTAALAVIDTVLGQGIDAAMNRWNAPGPDDEERPAGMDGEAGAAPPRGRRSGSEEVTT